MSPALPSLVNCGGKQGEDRGALCGRRKEIRLCDFPLFSLFPVVTWFSCREILIWVCVYSFCLSSSLLSLSFSSSTPCPLSSHPRHPHISISVPGCWRNTDGPGSGKDVNLRERCLLWVFHCQEETLLVFCLPCLILSLLTGIYFLNFGKFLFLPIVALCIDFYLSVECCEHTHTHTDRVYFWLCADFSVVFGSELVVL